MAARTGTGRASERRLLEGSRVLVVEDEVMIAMDLAWEVEAAGALVVGPAPSIRDALQLIDANGLCGAILDVNLLDGIVTPVIDRLRHAGIPVVMQSGEQLPADIAQRHGDVPTFRKPAISADLVRRLARLIEQR